MKDSGYLYAQQQKTPTPSGPSGTQIAIVGNATVIPYTNTTTQSPTNSPCWQMYYANQNVSFNTIIQYTYQSGVNSWIYYIAKATSINSKDFSTATVTSIGSTPGNVSYSAGGTTSSSVSSQTVNAGYYFLIGCVNGPYYKTFNATSNNYVFTSSGIPKLTMINQSYWRNHGAADQSMTIPTQLGGTGTFNAPVNTIWCLNIGGIS
jgi:hypothetical protein